MERSSKEIRKDAEESVRQRPEVAADLFVGAGVLREVQRRSDCIHLGLVILTNNKLSFSEILFQGRSSD